VKAESAINDTEDVIDRWLFHLTVLFLAVAAAALNDRLGIIFDAIIVVENDMMV
jgi:hypothetical protein